MKLIQGDCTEIMLALDENSIDTVITDPPYGLEFMGKEWDALGATVSPFEESWVNDRGKRNAPFGGGGNRVRYGNDVSGIQVFHYQWALQALRIAKPGAFMFCFGGTRTFHRIACGIEDAGWKIRDTMMWIYGSGFPKSYNIGKNINGWDGWGTALKPAFEPIIIAMKPCENTYVENALKWGVAGLNIDGGRVPTGDDTTTRHNSSSSYMTQAIGEVQPKQDEYITGSNKGRWPANIIHDGSEEVVELFPQSKSTRQLMKPDPPKDDRGTLQLHPRKHAQERGHNDSGSAARFFYCAKASKAERNAGLEGMEYNKRDLSRNAEQPSMNGGDGNPYNRGAKPVINNHPTVKPLSLMEYLCRLSATPTGGIVLDPFMGSGTTGMACKKVGRDFIGIELDPHYFEIAEKRIASVIQQELI